MCASAIPAAMRSAKHGSQAKNKGFKQLKQDFGRRPALIHGPKVVRLRDSSALLGRLTATNI
jgi:hypothetical protein